MQIPPLTPRDHSLHHREQNTLHNVLGIVCLIKFGRPHSVRESVTDGLVGRQTGCEIKPPRNKRAQGPVDFEPLDAREALRVVRREVLHHPLRALSEVRLAFTVRAPLF